MKVWALSVDLRERIVKSYLADEGSYAVLGERFKVGWTTVYRLVRQFKQTGDLEPKRTQGGRNRKITPEVELLLREFVAAKPDATLLEYIEMLVERAGVQVSDTAMCAALLRLGLTRKKSWSARRSETRSA